jgi:hypothetical protein
MSQVLKIRLPEDSEQVNLKEIETELKQVDGVKYAGSAKARGGELETALLVVQLIGQVMSAASTAYPTIQKIGSIFHRKGLKGVTVEGPNGIKISLDKASPEDVQKLVDAMKSSA